MQRPCFQQDGGEFPGPNCWAQPPSLAGGGRSATGDTSIQDGGGGGLSAETLHTALQPGA